MSLGKTPEESFASDYLLILMNSAGIRQLWGLAEKTDPEPNWMWGWELHRAQHLGTALTINWELFQNWKLFQNGWTNHSDQNRGLVAFRVGFACITSVCTKEGFEAALRMYFTPVPGWDGVWSHHLDATTSSGLIIQSSFHSSSSFSRPGFLSACHLSCSMLQTIKAWEESAHCWPQAGSFLGSAGSLCFIQQTQVGWALSHHSGVCSCCCSSVFCVSV